MKFTKLILLLIVIFISISVSAQKLKLTKVERAHKKQSLLDSVDLSNLEIGINIAPYVSVILGTYPEKAILSATIKTKIGNQSYLKISPRYISNPKENFYFNNNLARTLSNTDSAQVDQNILQDNHAVQMNIGYEFRIPKGRWQIMLGADLFYRFGWETMSVSTLYYSKDSTTHNPVMKITDVEFNDEKKGHSHFIGIMPFYGLWFELSPNFSIAASMTAAISMGSGTFVSYNSDFELDKVKSSSSVFETGPLISDLTLSYRF
jgi:hypothetical protein|tara:strand:- start:249 stop:1037 length:789 start_codon:yes stop_codon:yes gene_type:complete